MITTGVLICRLHATFSVPWLLALTPFVLLPAGDVSISRIRTAVNTVSKLGYKSEKEMQVKVKISPQLYVVRNTHNPITKGMDV